MIVKKSSSVLLNRSIKDSVSYETFSPVRYFQAVTFIFDIL